MTKEGSVQRFDTEHKRQEERNEERKLAEMAMPKKHKRLTVWQDQTPRQDEEARGSVCCVFIVVGVLLLLLLVCCWLIVPSFITLLITSYVSLLQ